MSMNMNMNMKMKMGNGSDVLSTSEYTGDTNILNGLDMSVYLLEDHKQEREGTGNKVEEQEGENEEGKEGECDHEQN